MCFSLIARFVPSVILLFAALPYGTAHAQESADLPLVRIGIVADGNPPNLDTDEVFPSSQLVDFLKGDILALTRQDFAVEFPDDRTLWGSWSLEKIRASIDVLLNDPEIDLVLAVGIFATQHACLRESLPKPVVGNYAFDINAQGLPYKLDEKSRFVSGRKNLSYSISPGSALQDLTAFKDVGRVSRIHVLVESLTLDALPGLIEFSEGIGHELDLDVTPISVGRSAEEALQLIPPDAEAVYVTPLQRMTSSEFDLLITGLNERRLKTFSLFGSWEVERGIMASVRPITNFNRISRRVALNVQRILMGEEAASLPLVVEQPGGLMINMATVRAIGHSIPWKILIEAKLLNEEIEASARLTLDDAVREALAANLTLQALDREVAAGEEGVGRARSVLWPQLEASASFLQIDDDRAEASFGSQAERTLTGAASLSQLIWSDSALAGIDITEYFQSALEQQREAERLDIALDAAVSFLNVLRAQTLARIEKENLHATQSNLELAIRRQKIGYSGPADVYRWESEVATNRSKVIAAVHGVNSAMAVLNQILHRPLEILLSVESPRLEDPRLLTGHGRLATFVETPEGVERFLEFLIKEGLENSPEIRAFDAIIFAKERELQTAKRSYWSPDVFFGGGFDRRFATGGKGASSLAMPLPIEGADRNDWSLAIQATLPLFTGGERRGKVLQVTEELSQLRLERSLLAERIELRIRVAMFGASGSYPAIELAEEAAEAARKNRELVTDAYSRGVVTIIDLVDAQNADLVAEQFAANAVYDFLLDLMELQRAANTFGFFKSELDREQWFQRLIEFNEAASSPSER